MRITIAMRNFHLKNMYKKYIIQNAGEIFADSPTAPHHLRERIKNWLQHYLSFSVSFSDITEEEAKNINVDELRAFSARTKRKTLIFQKIFTIALEELIAECLKNKEDLDRTKAEMLADAMHYDTHEFNEIFAKSYRTDATLIYLNKLVD